MPFFAVLSLCALILAGQGVTPLHWVLYHTLPGFEWMHPHGPGRIKVILYLGLALLAGTTLGSLGKRGPGLGAVMGLPALTVLFLSSRRTLYDLPLAGPAQRPLHGLARGREP